MFVGEDFIPGNFGLRDQLFALDWLYDNIKVFGGDPDNLALVGQGSGAASIAYLYQVGRGKKLNLLKVILMFRANNTYESRKNLKWILQKLELYF